MDTVKIGPIVYTVKEVERLQDTRGQVAWGEADFGACEIRLEATANPQFKRITLWHEIVHAILVGAGVDSSEHDEVFVDQLAYGIMQVLQDNPELASAPEDSVLAQLRDSAVQTPKRKRNAAV